MTDRAESVPEPEEANLSRRRNIVAYLGAAATGIAGIEIVNLIGASPNYGLLAGGAAAILTFNGIRNSRRPEARRST